MAWPILDYDIWWHLANGHDILANLSIPRTENFSHTLAGRPWIDFEWFFQVAAYTVERLGGLRAVTWTKSLIVSGALLLVSHSGMIETSSFQTKRKSIPLPTGGENEACPEHVRPSTSSGRTGRRGEGNTKDVGLAFLGFWWSFFLYRTRALERPEIVTLALVPLFLLLILRARDRDNPKLLVPLPLLMVLWVNSHGGFVLGLGLLGLTTLGLYLENQKSRHSGESRNPAIWTPASAGMTSGLRRDDARLPVAMLFCFLICFVACFLNPYGLRVFEVPFQHILQGSGAAGLIEEWKILTLSQYPSFWILLVVSFGFLFWDISKRHAEGIFWAPLLLTFGFWASRHVRNPALYAPVAIPYVLSRSHSLMGSHFHWLRRLSVPVAFALIFPFVLGLRKRDIHQVVAWSRIPKGAADFIQRENVQGRMYNTYEWGGYLEWRFGVGRPVFFDGRYLFLPLLKEEAEAQRSPEHFAEWLERYQVSYAVIRHASQSVTHDILGHPLEIPRSPWAFLFPRRLWALVYWDDTALVYVRRAGPGRKHGLNAEVIASTEYRMPDPDDVDLWLEGVRRGFFKKEDLLNELARHEKQTGPTRTGDLLLERIRAL